MKNMKFKLSKNWALSKVKQYSDINPRFYKKVVLHLEDVSYIRGINKHDITSNWDAVYNELEIIPKINDLSKVVFINRPIFITKKEEVIYIESKKFDITCDQSLFNQKYKNYNEYDVISRNKHEEYGRCNRILINDIIKSINDEIDLGKTIYCLKFYNYQASCELESIRQCAIISKYTSI